MAFHDLSSYIGHRCQVMLNCETCGGQHVRTGTLAVAREPGTMELGGVRFAVSQVRAVVDAPCAESERSGMVVSRRLIDVAWLGLLGLTMASAWHAFVR